VPVLYCGTIPIGTGPAAAEAFHLGTLVGAVIGLSVIGLLYVTGTITAMLAGYTLVLLFPIYLILVAVVLSLWLGYDKDASALRPVYRTK